MPGTKNIIIFTADRIFSRPHVTTIHKIIQRASDMSYLTALEIPRKDEIQPIICG